MIYQFSEYRLAIEPEIDVSIIKNVLTADCLCNAKSSSSNEDCWDLKLSTTIDSCGIELRWRSAADAELKYSIDVDSLSKQHHSFPIAKQGAFNQALGKKSKNIIDASGGWGGDALLMAMQGYQVTVVERQPIMAILLQDAFARFAREQWVRKNAVPVPSLVFANAQHFFVDNQMNADCVYFDPMFPPKRKKTAAVNKRIQLLQWLVGQDTDADGVLNAAITAGFLRIAVKRPHYASPVLENPSEQFSSKLVHYDVYLNS